MSIPKAIMCWSGGKDSAYCLHKVLSEQLFDVKYLLTTVNDTFKRVSMHGVRENFLKMQVHALGIPLLTVRVSEGTNNEYEKQMENILLQVKAKGIRHVIFGDIFLEDLRKYREKNLKRIGMKGVFPIWKMDTKVIIDDFISQGFKTITCCTNDGYLDEHWVGKEIDAKFINSLPESVDPCGENGEFHTFCYAGPLYEHSINFSIGEKVYKPLDIRTGIGNIETKGFWFCDLKEVEDRVDGKKKNYL